MFQKISFIGAGKMAEAIIAGLVSNESLIQKEQIIVTNKQNDARLDELHQLYGVTTTRESKEIFTDSEMIILSMKPKDAEEALTDIKHLISPDQLVVSMLAGIEAKQLEDYLGNQVPVVRTMPNTSAMVGASATGVSKGTYATDKHVHMTEKLFQTIGSTVVIPETDMHGLTSISGSGPAYFYYMVEAMEQAAVDVGLNKDLARELVLQTFAGASKMLQETNESPTVLRENITSPNGTTEAGIQSLQQDDFAKVIDRCVKSARDRSIAMSQGK